MPSHHLAALAQAGVLEYARRPGLVALRASPRFLAHAETAAARLGTHASLGTVAVLRHALATWDDEGAGLEYAAPMLADFLAERGQMGSLRPVFPILEQFAAA